MTTIKHITESSHANSIPSSESKAREWVSQLPIADTGETAKRLYHGLVEFNRRALAPIDRIRISEVIRPSLEMTIQQLQRHLSYRTFPLPPRGQRIFDLHHALLMEFAGAYQLSVLDMLTRHEINKRGLLIAVYRALDYMGQLLLVHYAVYTRIRDTLWHDIHQLYLAASEQGVENQPYPHSTASAKTIAARYAQINLLALMRPYSLRQEEVFKVMRYIETKTECLVISPEPQCQTCDFAHAVMLNTDEPAVIMPLGDIPLSPTVRVFNMNPLLSDLEHLALKTNHADSASLISTEGLSSNLAQRLHTNLTTIRNRSFNRFPKNETILVVTRLSDILIALSSPTSAEQIEEEQNEEDLLYGSMISPTSATRSTNKINPQDEVLIQTWQVMNSSVNGYGLQWQHPESSSSRVGELVGLRDPNQEHGGWSIGVIKWMESSRERGLCCGIEVLSPKAMSLIILQVLNRDFTQTLPVHGLILPSIEGVRPDAVLILPAYMFRPNDEVLLSFSKREERVRLTRIDESLGSFAHFHFENRDQIKTPIGQTLESFDELWASL